MVLTAFVIGILVGLVIANWFMHFRILLLWRRAFFSRARVSLPQVFGIHFRGHSPELLIDTLIKLRTKGRTDIDIQQIERFYITDGHANMESSAFVELLEQEFKPEE